ncbi:MAG: hypothetical protein ACJ8CR_25500 [Roseiflexaceae bacterium]
MKPYSRARSPVRNTCPDEAERITDGDTETVPVSALREGDLMLVRPGASVPADSAVVQSSAAA